LSLKLRHQHEITTRLVRYLAVRDARLPGGLPPPPPES
jgi:hypothetical protein